MSRATGSDASLLSEYRRYLTSTGRAASTIKRRVADAERFLRAQTVPLEALREDHLVSFLSRSGWAAETRHVQRASLQSFFAWASSQGHVESNPADALSVITRRSRVARAASESTIRKSLLSADDRTQKMIMLAAYAGLKPMEIAAARPRDVVRDADGEYSLIAQSGRGDSRNVALPRSLADLIRATEGEYLFPGQDNGHLSAAYVSKLLSAATPAGDSAETLRRAFRNASTRKATEASWRDFAGYHSLKSPRFVETLELGEGSTLRVHFDRIARDLENDPAGAISSCKNLLEAFFKMILEREGREVSRPDLPALYMQAAALVGVDAASVEGNSKGSDAIRKAVRSASATVQALGELRNAVGTGHGSAEISQIEVRHARLAFNCTIAVAEFVSESWLRP